jgi:hypothetical protein
MKGKYERTSAVKERQSATMRGKPSPFIGKKHSDEARKKMRDAKSKYKTEPVERCCSVCGTEWVAYIKRDRERKYCSVNCYKQTKKGKPFYDASKIDKSYMKTEEYSKTKRKPDTPAYKKYRNRVNILTEKTYKKYCDIINPEQHPRTLAGVEGGFQLDHIISVRFCFDNGITPEQCSAVENLQILPWKTNLLKG